jgi:ABC-type transport system substrate-binding protein
MSGLRFVVAPDAGTRAQGVLANQIDIALGLGPSEIGVIEDGRGKGVSWRNASVWAIHFHQVTGGHPAFRDRRVREAVNLAVDRDSLVRTLLQGRTVPANQPVPQMAFGYDPQLPPIPYDPPRAKALLTEAGYADGFRFVLQGVIGSGPADGDVYQKVAQDLSRIGVTMEIRPFPVAQLIRSVVEGRWEGDAFGLTISTEPTIDALRPMIQHSCLNRFAWYCDKAIMPTVKAATVETDPARALALRQEVMRHYRHAYAALYLYELPRFAGLRAGVTGFAEVHGFVSFDRIEVAK